MSTWIFWELSLASKQNPLWPAWLQSQDKCTKLFGLRWRVLCSWTMNILVPCFDNDINDDVNSLYVEIIVIIMALWSHSPSPSFQTTLKILSTHTALHLRKILTEEKHLCWTLTYLGILESLDCVKVICMILFKFS